MLTAHYHLYHGFTHRDSSYFPHLRKPIWLYECNYLCSHYNYSYSYYD